MFAQILAGLITQCAVEVVTQFPTQNFVPVRRRLQDIQVVVRHLHAEGPGGLLESRLQEEVMPMIQIEKVDPRAFASWCDAIIAMDRQVQGEVSNLVSAGGCN